MAGAIPGIDNAQWHILTDPYGPEGQYGAWLSYSLVLVPLGFLLFTWLRETCHAAAFRAPVTMAARQSGWARTGRGPLTSGARNATAVRAVLWTAQPTQGSPAVHGDLAKAPWPVDAIAVSCHAPC